MQRRASKFSSSLVIVSVTILAAPAGVAIEPSQPALSGFDSYVRGVESRLEQQHRAKETFLAKEDATRLRHGELIIEKLTPPSGADLPGALLHHWRGTAFAAGVTAADFQRLMSDYAAYPKKFSPQVVRASVIARQDEHFQVLLRVRQKHVITVVMDTVYDITHDRLDEQHRYSLSRSTKISEIESPGTSRERALSPGEQHGFLWRMNTYWSYEERDHGLYMQIESVSLTRSIPAGLAWAIGPFVQSIPRDSLEFTLRSACNALRK